jgi:hypothetical protein
MPKIPKPSTTQLHEGNAVILPVPGGSRLGDRLRLAKSHEAPRIVKIVSIAPPQLGEDAYHGKIGDFLRAVSLHTEATDAAVLAHLLPAIGTAIGPGPTFYAGNPQPSRVNGVVVGETNLGAREPRPAPSMR